MEAPVSSASSPAENAPSSRGTGRGGRSMFRSGRGTNDHRGRGRGYSHGGRNAFQGRGRDRGNARGHGDTRGRGRGRGKGQPEDRDFAPKKFMRHRSLSGKHGSHTPLDGERAVKREKKDKKPNSNFALLRSTLGDAETIAEYIRDYHSSKKFSEVKSVNAFLQAVSQRPKAVYEELMSQYKDEVFTTLERLFALYALGKTPMIPPAHEFLIRCEQEGVRKSAWGEGVRTLPVKAAETDAAIPAEGEAEGVAPSPQPPAPVAPPLDAEAGSLLSPRELLKKLASLDVVGRLQRLIEMSRSVADIQVCANKLTALITDARDDVEKGSVIPTTSAEKFDYAAKCQLISKLLSKARRLVEPTFAPPSRAAADGASDNLVEKPAEEATVRRSEQVFGGDDEEELPRTAAEAAFSGTSATAVDRAAPVVTQRRVPLTDDEIEGFQAAISVAFHALETVLEQHPPSVTHQPLSKFCKVLEWCKGKGLLASADERFATLLEQQVEKDIAEQANQIKTVISLKSLTAGDTAALREVVDQLWEAGGSLCFSPSSMDVLSAIAVAASVDDIDADVKRLVADRLVQTQRHLADTVALPRRALRFVNDERNKVKQAAIAKQLQAEASKHKTEGDEREGEGLR
ncbi:conserved hypothetical protein [Leishmania major strain Friedlin]|uniref:Uncharacterized protein n=1 Tax=Leishmania major TaxID=5664 RepID=Q4Q0Q4_LEIMA|nr:conserved hypothetical protein [Leishmania major strain Friedlin]CAG9584060.1 hypothetical_protein_-_conserved [Leishmania major strain Friedlin]CAJ09480.1 conserved hypothetical protein [Leishmania major strain Friedlin]|eukprot:XP_001687094.1 conserved hypothetical protein [Leishmania major strain Friedlin]